MVGQVKSVKTVLKQLQQSIQTITAPGWPSDEEMLAMSQHPADAFQVSSNITHLTENSSTRIMVSKGT